MGDLCAAEHPGAWDTAADEVEKTLGGRVPGADDLKALTYLNGVVHEALRLYPPGVVSARKVIRDLWFNGHRIRAGRMLLFSPYVTHRLPELWPEPHQFRSERWDPDSPDYRKPGPHEFLPFSGGPHRCIGSAMATTELTVMLARLLARTSLRLLTSPKCSWSNPIAQHGRDERPPPDRWITRLVAGAVTLVAVVGALVIAISVVVGVVRIVRHDARLGAKRLKRYNAFILPIAGRRTSPYALLRHTGRRSGRTYLTPLGAYRFGDGFVLGLTYGPDAEWCRNVVASGYAVLRWHGQDYALERPEVIPMNPRVLRAFPLPFRNHLARELTQCLWLHQPIQAPEYAPPDDRTDFATTAPEQ